MAPETLDWRTSAASRQEAQTLEQQQAAMARQQAEIERQQAGLAKAQADLASQQKAMADEQSKLEGVAEASRVVWTKDVEVVFKATLAVSLSAREAVFDVDPALVGDRVYVHRRGEPAITGVTVAPLLVLEGTGFVPAAKKVRIFYLCPVLGVAQTLTIPLKLVGLRAAA